MSFQGSLDKMKLPEIIQLVSVTGKTGKFAIDSIYGKGDIYLHEGEIIHADTDGNLKGENALYSIAIWEEGDFLFHPDSAPEEHSIKKNNTALLMEIAKRLDEWKILKRYIYSINMLVYKVPEPNKLKIKNLTKGEMQVYDLIDGSKKITELANEINIDLFSICKYLFGLLSMKLIYLQYEQD